MAKDDAFKSSFIHRKADLEIDKLFRACVKLKASDLHLKVDKPPMVRVDGTLRPMNREPISDEEMVRLCFPLMNERNRKIFERDGGADFAHTTDVDGTIWRFRVNLLQQLGHVGMVARRVSSWIPDFEGLNLPPSIEQLCTYDQGMVLLAGVTLDIVNFPRQLEVAAVPAGSVDALGYVVGPGIMLMFVISALFVLRYRMSRRGHQEVLRGLAQRA